MVIIFLIFISLVPGPGSYKSFSEFGEPIVSNTQMQSLILNKSKISTTDFQNSDKGKQEKKESNDDGEN